MELSPAGVLRRFWSFLPGVVYLRVLTVDARCATACGRTGSSWSGIVRRPSPLSSWSVGGGTTVCEWDWIAIVWRVRLLRYGERDEGINLVWSLSPSRVGDRRRPADDAGADPPEGAARQCRSGDYLCYAVRDTGINLRWWADTVVFSAYPPLPMPQQYRGPSGQPGQVELTARRPR